MFFYSPRENMFYPSDLKDIYINAGTFPIDTIEVSDSIYIEFASTEPPSGKMRVAGIDGLPVFIDIPPQTKDELIEIANIEKLQRLAIAKNAIELLSDAVDFDEATIDDIVKLKEWKKYRLTLTRTTTSTAPDIAWPSPPIE